MRPTSEPAARPARTPLSRQGPGAWPVRTSRQRVRGETPDPRHLARRDEERIRISGGRLRMWGVSVCFVQVARRRHTGVPEHRSRDQFFGPLRLSVAARARARAASRPGGARTPRARHKRPGRTRRASICSSGRRQGEMISTARTGHADRRIVLKLVIHGPTTPLPQSARPPRGPHRARRPHLQGRETGPGDDNAAPTPVQPGSGQITMDVPLNSSREVKIVPAPRFRRQAVPSTANRRQVATFRVSQARRSFL